MRMKMCFVSWVVILAVATAASAGVPSEMKVHPRLLFTDVKVDELRRRVADDAAVRQAWDAILRRADKMLNDDLVSKEYAEGGAGQHGNYGRPSAQMSQMGQSLGLAYRMTKDPRYADKLKAAMLHYGAFDRWAGDGGHVPRWNSELNTARFCYGFAVGFDSIYDALSPAEREKITKAMVRLGIEPTLNDWLLGDKRIHALDSMGHNWWSVCVSMAGLGVLAVIGDEPRAPAWADAVEDGLTEWFSYSGNVLQNKSTNFDRDGAFYESVNYANYALSEYLLFRLAWGNAFAKRPPADIPLLEKVGDFFVQTCYPASDGMLAVNFGDSSLTANAARALRLLIANGFDKPEYRWYIERRDPGLEDVLGLLYYASGGAARLPAVNTSTAYEDIGWAMMRSSWEDDATLLAVKSGFAWNHAHPDAGSFILFHEGKPLIIDSGNCSYSRREYTSYYRTSRAHNVILVDGQAEDPEACGGPDRGVVTPGGVHRLLEGAGVKYVFADATGPTAWKFSRNYRHFLWVGDVIVIVDDVRVHEPGTLEWLLHYEGQARQGDGAIEIANGEARAIVRPMFPEGIQMTEKKGLKDHDPDTEVRYLALSPDGERREEKFITVILPVRAGRAPARIERLKGSDALGIRIHEGDSVTDVWLNMQADGRKMHRNSCNIIAGWETDAYLFALTYEKGANVGTDDVRRCFVGCGSYLRRDGAVLLDSLSKVFATFTVGRSNMEVVMAGQSLVRARMGCERRPDSLAINGRPAAVQWDERQKSLTLRMVP
ncbi:MAG: heparinase II/III family protein [Phycisphaerae bacterium]|nr:heparinase II/III family protein [Phycisphaerae bacterium]